MQPVSLVGARSEVELFRIVRMIRDANPSALLLFRGQTESFEDIRSGRARGRHVVHEVEIAWSRLAARMIGAKETEALEQRFAQALLQHYGLATYLVDLTAHPSIAAWFALNRFHFQHNMWAGVEMRSFKRVQYQRLNNGYGYVHVLAFPRAADLEAAGQLFCLSHLPQEVLRPHRQLGWLFYDGLDSQHNLSNFHVASIRIEREQFDLPGLSQNRLFPEPKTDIAYRHLLGFPWAQVPTIYLGPSPASDGGHTSDEDVNTMLERMCFAERVISVPEYFDNQDGYDHKWDDITLYEPHPVRAWRYWRFELSSRFPQWHGDIANSTKITLSEGCRTMLENAGSDIPCTWPDVESDDIFYSFSQMGHDKVIDHGPPYRGVWLHRAGDWIVETVTTADADVLSLGPGLAFLLREGKLAPQDVPGNCSCGDIDSHSRRVGAMLRLSHFVSRGRITFVPHPAFFPNWYIAV